MVPYNRNSLTYNLVVLFSDTGTVEEWLKFVQNLQVVISKQNITDAQGGAYVITKNLLQGDVLTDFKNAARNKEPQTELNYKQTMKDMHARMSYLQAYVTQTCYMC
eukprot:7981343-Ditylum_brightwellii.AAC.1